MQQFYVAQIRVGFEKKFIEKFYKQTQLSKNDCALFFLERLLDIRRQGKITRELKPIFSGYVFIVVEELSNDLALKIKQTENFIRFLPSSENIQALSGNDLELIKRYNEFGEVWGASKVYFNENDRIVVTEGPLFGQEGNIVKVDRRKKRAKVKLSLANCDYTIDLAFEVIEVK